MFIRYQNNPIINLDNVSNVFIDRKESKVIFNMNYAIRITSDTITSDYVSWKYENLDEIVNLLNDVLKRAKFIIPNNIYNRYVNPKCVASIKIEEANKKVIFNLNSTVTHPMDASSDYNKKSGKQRLTSDFVFIKFNNTDEFYEYCEILEELYSVV